MNKYTLVRVSQCNSGTYGYLIKDGEPFCLTLEPKNPIIPKGTYECYRVNSPKRGYEVYQFRYVPGHVDVQIHKLNVYFETQGCIGIGMGLSEFSNSSIGVIPKIFGFVKGIFGSKTAFEKLMKEQIGFIILEVL
jgi:hypothetical protein